MQDTLLRHEACRCPNGTARHTGTAQARALAGALPTHHCLPTQLLQASNVVWRPLAVWITINTSPNTASATPCCCWRPHLGRTFTPFSHTYLFHAGPPLASCRVGPNTHTSSCTCMHLRHAHTRHEGHWHPRPAALRSLAHTAAAAPAGLNLVHRHRHWHRHWHSESVMENEVVTLELVTDRAVRRS